MELVLIFVSGMLGSSHCLGMCGGFAVIVGMRSTTAGSMALTQLAFTLGRIFTYTAMGVVAGSIGARTAVFSRFGINAVAILSIVAGLFLLAQGLLTLGIRWLPRRFQSSEPCLLASGYRSLLQGAGWPSVFLAGVLTGFLPCGLVYGFVSLAAATGDPLRGGIVMSLFGLGTAPLMVAAGWGGSLLTVLARQRLLRFAAVCVVLIGIVTLARGVGHLQAPHEDTGSACPFCIGETSRDQPDVL